MILQLLAHGTESCIGTEEQARVRRTRNPVESTRTLIQDAGDQQPRRRPFAARRSVGQPDASEPQLVLDRYLLLERLGAGGFGVVWRAHDQVLQREVAVKRIWLGAGDVERATREAHASARLSHPAIVALYEAYTQGEAFYLISELVQGRTLARLIAQDELDDEEIVAVGLALLDALEHAHGRGVVHRDIKPQNVLVPDTGGDPAAKLTDFGGASIAGEDALTRTGDVLGTLAYMAPEQSEGLEAGEEADLYSLALVLYEALSGVNPVRGASPAETAKRIGTRLEPLHRRRRDLPRALTVALDRALAPDPRGRGDLADLRMALQEHGAGDLDGPRRSPRRATAPVTPSWEAAPALPAHRLPRARPEPLVPSAGPEPTAEAPAPLAEPATAPGLPRLLWAGLALALVIWQVVAGRPGLALVLAAGLIALALVPAEPRSGRVSVLWAGCLAAPLLGVVGLAAAYPAIAGQARRWRARLALGAVGYWWLLLAEPVLGRRLWLGPARGTPAPAAWESSIGPAATHAIGPLLSAGTLLGAALWGAGALVLPWLVRGRHAAVDVVAATVWSALLVGGADRLDGGLSALSHPSPRGLVLGAVLGGMVAVGARALRGPV